MKWRDLAIDVAGVTSFALICTGTYLVFGKGWTLIAAGVPPFALYGWHLVRLLRGRRRP
jgi:hypothetical protein